MGMLAFANNTQVVPRASERAEFIPALTTTLHNGFQTFRFSLETLSYEPTNSVGLRLSLLK